MIRVPLAPDAPRLAAVLWLAVLPACVAESDGTPEGTPDTMPEACPALELGYASFATADFVATPDTMRGPTGLAVLDADGDGTDEVLLGSMGGSVLLSWDGSGFSAGAALPAATGAAVADVDLDGDMDVALATWEGSADLLLYNDSGTFRIEELPDSTGQSTTPAFADFDGDGRLDLFMARGWTAEGDLAEVIAEAPPGDPSSLYLWRDGGFVDASDQLPAVGQGGYTFHAAPVDADLDGDLDVWLANDMGPFILPDLLLLNDGAARFSVADETLAHFGMGVAVGDANADGLPDLFVTDLGGPDLLLGQGDGGFYDATLALGADLGDEPDRMVSWGARFVDVDGDGRDDLPVAFGRGDASIQEDVGLVNPDWAITEDQRDALLLADDGGFRDVGDELGVATDRHRGMVVLDLDGDRVPEVVTVGKSDLAVYHYGGGCPARITIEIHGDAATPAVGARVVVRAERETTRWVLPSSMGSASSTVVFAGIGHADKAEVEVLWPDGRVADYDASAGDLVVASPADGIP